MPVIVDSWIDFLYAAADCGEVVGEQLDEVIS
jgi:hypothetical protein